MAKNIFLIPGFQESTKDSQYKPLKSLLRKKGYTVIEFNPTWKRSVISTHAEDFISFAKQKNISISDCIFLAFLLAPSLRLSQRLN